MNNALKRSVRLPKAKLWLEIYNGKNIIRGYAKKFAVDKLCAIIELRMLGVDISEADEEKVKIAIENKQRLNLKLKQKRLEELQEKEEYQDPCSDDYFAYIAGYTSNGVPFGITYEEMEQMESDYNVEMDEDSYNEMLIRDTMKSDTSIHAKGESYPAQAYDVDEDLPF